jgi:hypothetical protein
MFPKVDRMFPEVDRMFPEVDRMFPEVDRMFPEVPTLTSAALAADTCPAQRRWQKSSRLEPKRELGMARKMAFT